MVVFGSDVWREVPQKKATGDKKWNFDEPEAHAAVKPNRLWKFLLLQKIRKLAAVKSEHVWKRGQKCLN